MQRKSSLLLTKLAGFNNMFKSCFDSSTQTISASNPRSLGELQSTLRKKYTHQEQTALEKIWAEYDVNNDGELSKEENLPLVKNYFEAMKVWFPQLMDELLSANMGFLQGNTEIGSVFSQLKEKLIPFYDQFFAEIQHDAQPFADAMWESMDLNKDGRVVKDEFLKQFVECSDEIVDIICSRALYTLLSLGFIDFAKFVLDADDGELASEDGVLQEQFAKAFNETVIAHAQKESEHDHPCDPNQFWADICLQVREWARKLETGEIPSTPPLTNGTPVFMIPGQFDLYKDAAAAAAHFPSPAAGLPSGVPSNYGFFPFAQAQFKGAFPAQYLAGPAAAAPFPGPAPQGAFAGTGPAAFPSSYSGTATGSYPTGNYSGTVTGGCPAPAGYFPAGAGTVTGSYPAGNYPGAGAVAGNYPAGNYTGVAGTVTGNYSGAGTVTGNYPAGNYTGVAGVNGNYAAGNYTGGNYAAGNYTGVAGTVTGNYPAGNYTGVAGTGNYAAGNYTGVAGTGNYAAGNYTGVAGTVTGAFGGSAGRGYGLPQTYQNFSGYPGFSFAPTMSNSPAAAQSFSQAGTASQGYPSQNFPQWGPSQFASPALWGQYSSFGGWGAPSSSYSTPAFGDSFSYPQSFFGARFY